MDAFLDQVLTLVLYSSPSRSWKLADFGISSPGNSGKAVVTVYARGTGGFRAPELIQEASTFTNKVDIWAVGCILYELVTGKRLFDNDWKVREYYTSRLPLKSPLALTGLPETYPGHLRSMISELLSREASLRPRASELRQLYTSYNTILQPSVPRAIGGARLPDYSQWKQLVRESTSGRDFLSRLAKYFSSKGLHQPATRLLVDLLRQNPADTKLREQLADAYKRLNDADQAIIGWKSLVEMYPFKRKLREQLSKACKEKGDTKFALKVYEDLTHKHPHNTFLVMEHAALFAEVRADANDWKTAIFVLKSLIDKRPNVLELQEYLSLACEGEDSGDSEIAIWKHLVETHPTISSIQAHLWRAIMRAGNEDESITVWEALVDQHPDNDELVTQLRRACEDKGDEDTEIQVWYGLVEKHPRTPALIERLREALRAKGNGGQAVTIWKLLQQKYPEIEELENETTLALENRTDDYECIALWTDVLVRGVQEAKENI